MKNNYCVGESVVIDMYKVKYENKSREFIQKFYGSEKVNGVISSVEIKDGVCFYEVETKKPFNRFITKEWFVEEEMLPVIENTSFKEIENELLENKIKELLNSDKYHEYIMLSQHYHNLNNRF